MIKIILRYPRDTKDWWQKAQDDIKYAEGNLSLGFYSQVCFLAQQAAEKALKTYLLSQNILTGKIHKLSGLLKKASEKNKEFLRLSDQVKILDRYYIGTRYPEILGLEYQAFDKETAEQALSLAEEIIDFVQKRLKFSN